jgi:ATP-dependent DNA helicase DinG
VLLGTSSFWEGVDVRGEALSCVVIDKLPFAAPDDPVLQARGDALRAAGGNPFIELHLPNAVIALKQGVGRLIRDVDDHGVLAICDPRLFGKSYGRRFLSMPTRRWRSSARSTGVVPSQGRGHEPAARDRHRDRGVLGGAVD